MGRIKLVPPEEYTSVLGLDVGMRNFGFACFDGVFRTTGTIDLNHIDVHGYAKFRTQLLALIAITNPSMIVAERFTYSPNTKGLNSERANLFLGWIQAIAHELGVTYYSIGAGAHKRWTITNFKLTPKEGDRRKKANVILHKNLTGRTQHEADAGSLALYGFYNQASIEERIEKE